jgi:HEAT repeat protein
MADTPPDVLSIETAARLTGFARACKAATRVVSLYPPQHPAISEALNRLAKAGGAATEHGALAITVMPTNLLIEGRASARVDVAVSEFAGLLHSHLIGEIVIGRDVTPSAWRILLALLAETPEDVRARGGIGRAWTTAGGQGLELHELDYSLLLREHTSVMGLPPTWEIIINNCLRGDALDLDEEAIRVLTDIARDPGRLGDFFERTAAAATTHLVPEGRAASLLRAMRGITGFFEIHEPEQLEVALANMASAASRLSPDFMLEVLSIARDPRHELSGLAHEVTTRMTDSSLARFVSQSVATERDCTARLAEAFRTLVPDRARGKEVVGLARKDLAENPLAADAGFDKLWARVESLLLSYSDSAHIPETYDREMAGARARAASLEHEGDDPPERVAEWLTSVSDAAVRALDLRLLLDLLAVEKDAAARQEVLRLVVAHVDELVAIGDFEGARMLVDGVGDVASTHRESGARLQATRALEQLATPALTNHLAFHLNLVREDEFEHVKAMCLRIGPQLGPRVATALAEDIRPRARQRLTDVLLGFGKQSRKSIDPLLVSDNPNVRRTAVQLLRALGDTQSVADLERLLRDEESAVQRDAIRALASIGTEGAFAVLQRTLSEKGAQRSAVIEELGATRDPRSTPLFCHIVRHVACRGAMRDVYLRSLVRLGVLGGPEAVAALSEALYRGSWLSPLRTREIRAEAAVALSQIKLPAAREALREAATRGSVGVRAAARRHVRD